METPLDTVFLKFHFFFFNVIIFPDRFKRKTRLVNFKLALYYLANTHEIHDILVNNFWNVKFDYPSKITIYKATVTE